MSDSQENPPNSRNFVDLHTHSTFSAGSVSPRELLSKADAESLKALALTDHDTTAGVLEALKIADEYPELQFISGIEVSAKFPGAILHILGLGVDPGAKSLDELTSRLQAAREERNPKIIAQLQTMGMKDRYLAPGPGAPW